jgi:hypothetical protein
MTSVATRVLPDSDLARFIVSVDHCTPRNTLEGCKSCFMQDEPGEELTEDSLVESPIM